MTMVATNMSGHVQKQLTRSLERILEEAYLSGELKLSGRKLKEFPKINKNLSSSKNNLQDTVLADLSKNRFTELPEEITELTFLEKLHLYHNAIRVIPETVAKLQSLNYLDLSRNQLTVLPREICRLPLQTLLVAYNRLTALPEELGRMSVLAELDAGCNEIISLPSRIGDLSRIRSLDLRNNFLVQIPIELTYLKLVKLDISGNRISVLPSEFRKMKSLIEFKVLDNPLTSPPAALCIRGRTHILKYLERQAMKHERARGCRLRQESSGLRGHATLDLRSHRRQNISSICSASDGLDKRWSQEINSVLKKNLPLSINLSFEAESKSSCSGNSTPSTISPDNSISFEEELEKITVQQERFGKTEIKHCVSKNEKELRKLFLTNDQLLSTLSNCVETSSLQRSQEINLEQPIEMNGSLSFINEDETKSLNHIQTYREYKEALRQQRVSEGASVYRLKEQVSSPGNDCNDGRINPSSMNISRVKEFICEETSFKRPVQKVIPSRSGYQNFGLSDESNNKSSNKNMIHFDKIYRKPDSPITTSDIFPETMNPEYTQKFSKIAVNFNEGDKNLKESTSNSSSSQFVTWNSNSSENYSFTMRREFERAKEEADLVEQLRNHIETRLKMTLPEDLAPALADGVVLCHLANHVKPRSVASVHVPSPGVPKLTMARCRRNVENFLEACRKIGVDEEVLLDAEAIMDEGYMAVYGLTALNQLVSVLVLYTEEDFQKLDICSARTIQDRVLSTLLSVTFMLILILLYVFPIPN